MVARINKSAESTVRQRQRVCSMAKQIRNSWTPEQREYRAELARDKIAQLAPWLFDRLH
jgi:hypothetical protein